MSEAAKQLELNPFTVDRSDTQVIYGTPPSKSNCYIIFTYEVKGKFDKKGRPKIAASLSKGAALKKYEKDFYIQCNKYRNKNIDEYFEFQMDVYYPNQRSDLDNSAKVVLDCLQSCHAIVNDNKCVRMILNKFLDKQNPRIEFTIKKASA